MAQHKKKRPPLQHHDPAKKIIARKNSRVMLVVMLLFILFGVGITFFAAGYNINWLLIGAIIGAVAGYFFGRLIINGLEKNK